MAAPQHEPENLAGTQKQQHEPISITPLSEASAGLDGRAPGMLGAEGSKVFCSFLFSGFLRDYRYEIKTEFVIAASKKKMVAGHESLSSAGSSASAGTSNAGNYAANYAGVHTVGATSSALLSAPNGSGAFSSGSCSYSSRNFNSPTDGEAPGYPYCFLLAIMTSTALCILDVVVSCTSSGAV